MPLKKETSNEVIVERMDSFITEVRQWREMEERRLSILEETQRKNVTDIAVNGASHAALINDIEGLKSRVTTWDLINSIAGLVLASLVGWIGLKKY